MALQRDDFHVPRQRLILQHAAHNGDVDIPFTGRNSTKLNIVLHSRGFAIGISFSNRADGSDMDILDIVLRRQVHDLALQGRVVILENAARFRFNRQLGKIIGVRHVARQVDTATVGIGALDINLAHIRADQPDFDGLGGVQGVVVEHDGGSADFPPIIDMFEPAKETGTGDPMIPVKSTRTQKLGAPIKAQLTAFRSAVASLRNHGALGQS